MLVQVEKKMREVTLNAPSYKELKQLYMAREIYMPERRLVASADKKTDFTAEEINEIQKKFFKGFQAFRGNEKLNELLEEIDLYMKELKAYNIQDSQVKNVNINFPKILGNVLTIIPILLVNLVFVSTLCALMMCCLESRWPGNNDAPRHPEQAPGGEGARQGTGGQLREGGGRGRDGHEEADHLDPRLPLPLLRLHHLLLLLPLTIV